MTTAPHLMKYYINKYFYRVPGRGHTCCKSLGLCTTISTKKLTILVHQEAAKLPAIKVFIAAKSSVLCSKWPDFGAKKTLTAGHF